MADGGPLSRECVINAIVTVFANSKLKEVVGTDALRTVLRGEYREMVRGGELHLQPAWDLMAEQPGFDPSAAEPPFCKLKQWEPELGLKVQLPDAVSGYKPTEVLAIASQCTVSDIEKIKALNPDEHARRRKAAQSVIPVNTIAAPATRKPLAEAALALVAIVGLAIGGITLAGSFSGPKFSSVSIQDLARAHPGDQGATNWRRTSAHGQRSELGGCGSSQAKGSSRAHSKSARSQGH